MRRSLLLIILLLPGLAQAQYFGKNKVQYESFDWQVYHSTHFDLYYYPEEAVLASEAVLLLEQAYERLAALLEHRPADRVPVVLYSAHPFFQQTNVTPELIGEATGGFTDIYRSRVVLPYQGSVPAFRHVVTHELVHVFMLDMLFGGLGPRMAMGSLGQMQMPPLWFIEGLAEYLSTGWDAEAEMFIQDAVAADYLTDLQDLWGGFMVYKEGQALIRHLVREYGEGILAELIHGTRRDGGFDKALENSLGLDVKELSRQFRRQLRAEAWDGLEKRPDPSELAFPLKEHEKDRRYYYRRPALSPRGDRFVYFADHEGEVNLYLASRIDGKVIRKLVTGHRSGALESVHAFESGAVFSPDGATLVFSALHGGRDELVMIDAEEGDEIARFRPGLDTLLNPSFSPGGDRIAVTGVSGGVTDLFMLELETGRWTRLTEDLADEQDVAWMSDGRLVFARHEALFPGQFEASGPGPEALDPAVFADYPEVFDTGAGYDLWTLELGGDPEPLLSTCGEDRHPRPLPGGGLVFSSDAGGMADLWHWEPGAEPRRFLAPGGGALDPALSADGRQLAFASLRQGGYDLFLLEDLPGLLAEADLDTPTERRFQPFDLGLLGQAPPPVVEEPDSLTGTGGPYKTRFLVDAMGRQLTYHNLYGFYGSSVIQLKDVLGDHEILIMMDIFGRISDSNFLVGYTNRSRRINWSVGGYSFLNYYQSTVSALGETLPEDRLFYEWSRGLWLGGSYPFSMFTRLEADLNFYYTRREYFSGTDLFGDPVYGDPRPDEKRLLVQPGISLVHDDALFDYLGPVKGSRWILGLSFAQDLGGDVEVSRWVANADWRRYLYGPGGHSLALRLGGRYSQGKDPLWFHLGGPMSLRGYDYLQFAGTRTLLGSIEWRFPFLRAAFLGGPLPFAFGNVGGAVFADVGGAWHEDEVFDPWENEDGFRLTGLKGDFGYGLRYNLGGWLLMWDWAWPTDLGSVGDRVVHFSIGAQF